MDLIINATAPGINTDAIHKGDLIRAKYSLWGDAEEPRNGQVASVTRDEIRVIWQPGIRNVTNFFVIPATEAAAGLWTVKWTSDMETIHTYDPAASDAQSGDRDVDDEL